jgi:septum formation protein
MPSGVSEVVTGEPREVVAGNARAKAVAVARRENGLILGVDTVVVLQGEILGKPRTAREAVEMLQRLSARTHVVLSGLHLEARPGDACRSAVEETVVCFRPLSPTEIERYVAAERPMDYAGAYAIQGRAGLFVDRLEGDYYNVMGLPLCRLELLLRGFGETLLDPAVRRLHDEGTSQRRS